MIARIVLTLLLALAALPAQAAPTCHEPATPAGTAMPMPMPARHHVPPTIDHHCLGCAALADWLADRGAALLVLPAPAPTPRPVRFLPRGAAPPALPPPRIG